MPSRRRHEGRSMPVTLPTTRVKTGIAVVISTELITVVIERPVTNSHWLRTIPQELEARRSSQCRLAIVLKFPVSLAMTQKAAAAAATRIAESPNGVISRKAILAGMPQVAKMTWTASSARWGVALKFRVGLDIRERDQRA